MVICALCYIYMKLIWCHGFAEIYAQLEGEFICFGCMCIVLYMKLIWCNGFPEICAQLEGGSSAMGICALCFVWNLFGVMVFQRSMLNWRRGWGQSVMGICPLCYIWDLFGVMVFQRSMLNWRGMGSIWHGYMCIVIYMKLMWWGGVNLP